MPNCEICDKNEIRLKKRISQGNEHKICSRCYSIITKNMREGKKTKMKELARFDGTSEETTVDDPLSLKKKTKTKTL